jgi:hypothetical protein
MPTTRTEIFNTALSFMDGHRLVTNDLEDSTEGRYLRAKWGVAARYCLERGSWAFAEVHIKLGPLALGANDSSYGFDHAFEKPGDWLNTTNVNGCDDREGSLELEAYRDTGGRICANTNNLHLWFVSEKVLNTPGKFSQSFANYVANELASHTIMKIAPSATKKRELIREGERLLSTALSFNARQSGGQRYKPGRIVRARQGGYRGYGR